MAKHIPIGKREAGIFIEGHEQRNGSERTEKAHCTSCRQMKLSGCQEQETKKGRMRENGSHSLASV